MIKRISTTIYKCRWFLVINEPYKTISEHSAKEFGEDFHLDPMGDEYDGGVWPVTGRSGYIVLIDEWEYTIPRTGPLGHECLHAAVSTLDYIGYNVKSADGDEPLAYLFQYYFESAMNLIAGEHPYPEIPAAKG